MTVACVGPRLELVPEGDCARGVEAVELARSAGLELDPWQEHVLVNSLRIREDGKWSALEVGLVVPRQNGKGAVLEARELAGLFLFGEMNITHSSHRVDTSMEAFRRLLGLIEDTPELTARLRKVIRTNGREGIELTTGERIRFTSRSTGGGRGLSDDLVVMDEAMFLAEAFHGALFPKLSARSIEGNPQAWYTGSAVDQWVHENGVVFSRVRERGHRGSRRLAFFEWCADTEMVPGDLEPGEVANREWWYQATPAMGIRIAEEHIEVEMESMDSRTFATERLGIGDWPRTDGTVETVISVKEWMGLVGEGTMREPLCVAFDVDGDRRTAVAVAGRRDDGLLQVEITEYQAGTWWLVDYLVGLQERRQLSVVMCDGYGSLSLVKACAEAGVDVETTTAPELAQACGRLVDGVNDKLFRHLGSDELLNAVRGSKARPLGDAWAWSRKLSSAGIAPLVAATLALSAAMDRPDGEIRIW